ncbi:PREDICTED: CDK5 regulatory subunit-associated protein 2-like [Elephantulus edwardii]|uniref:CDK5 regulatory subunit-associated protein 2-like n=1 Tax=Elephantulus edwardii TaxID=28737 RepID=UPI0003F093E8|nr:PREDICTED: CDK5 regulatory subunit-associated protein 2-like [Elephantulus edwardii]
MNSALDEDVTLPEGTLSGSSVLIPTLPDELDDVNPSAGVRTDVLPNVSEERLSPTRARNMKDFENQITELKKENFNLKLRIYFLEERMQQEFDGPTEHIYKTNIALKVEVESLKRELQEREQLLIKASKAVETLAEGGTFEIQRVKEDARKKVQQVEDCLTKKIHRLEEDVKAAQAELENAFTGTEKEKTLRLSLEKQLSEMKKLQESDMEMALVLKEKDRLIEELKLSLKSKEALIQCLKEEKSQMASADANVSSGELQGLSATLREEKKRETEALILEHQKERNSFEEKLQALQEDLREKEREIAIEKKNSLKRDKAIQGLTIALKSKEKEVEKLHSEIEELTAAFAEAREASQKAQRQKLQGSEEYEAALSEKEALLAELRSENLTKSTENHRLCRTIKKITQELSDLQQERTRLEKDLEEAHQEKSKDDCTIRDLTNQVEKLCDRMNERERAVENRYKSLLSENNKKLHSQEQTIQRLTESVNQKDLLLMKFNEKDLEAIQQNCHLMTAEDFKFRSEGLITEKCSSHQSPGSKIIFEDKQQSDYEELLRVLKKEQGIYSSLVKSLQDSSSINNLQAELNSIFALRKQLEQDVLAYRNLQKTLEEQINAIRMREEETFSFYSDQTSYLSICLEEHKRLQVDQFSQEDLKKKVIDLIQLVKELYTDNQHLKKTIFDLSCMNFHGNDRLESVEQMELLASQENADQRGEDDKKNVLSDQHLQQSNEIMEDSFKGGCKNGYLWHMDSNILDYDGTLKPDCPGDQRPEGGELMHLLGPFFNEKATLLLESRPDLLQTLHKLLLQQMYLKEQKVSGEKRDGKTKTSLQQMAIQLRGELRRFIQANSFSKPQDERPSPWEAQKIKMSEMSKVELKDASVQTLIMEGDTVRFTHEGIRKPWKGKPTDTMLNAEHQQENITPFSVPSAISKDAKKSRLPVLLKPSQSLGSMYLPPSATQEVVTQLQGQIMELKGELKEFKTRNKQLHQRLILAEAMMEGKPTSDQMLQNAQPRVGAAYQSSPGEQNELKTMPCIWKDKETDSNDQPTSCETDSEIYPPGDLAILPAFKENPSEACLRTTSVTSPCVSSKTQLSVKVSEIETDQSEHTEASNDVEYLKQKICDLETELKGYQNFLLQLQSGKHSQCSEAIITVLCGTEEAQEGLNKPEGNIEDEELTFSSLHQVHYVKHMKILHPVAPETIDGGILENLEQQLVEQEYELQKEQNLNMELFSEIHNLQNKFRDLSPSRYNSLVQSQARELSLQRQQLKDSHGICVVYRQHMNTLIKAFDELLRASDVDYGLAEGFQGQLNQCAQLLEELEKLFLSGKSAEVEASAQNKLIDRFEEDNLTYQHILPESPEPSASQALSDCEMSEKSSSSSRDQKQGREIEKISNMANNFSQEMLMEHIQEIRTLRKRLEESIKTNEKLRKQLERQGSEFDQGSASIFTYGSELHNSLTSEINFLRMQNQALNVMLAKGSRDKQKENEQLRESLSRKTAKLEHLQQEYACVKEENERLQAEAGEKERQNQQLLQEVYSHRGELSRAQEEVKLKGQLLSQNDELLQSLRVELKVYKKLDEEHRQSREASGEGCKGQDTLSDLHGLLREIQVLRMQLEKSIQTNSTLQSRLEEQLAKGEEKAQKTVLALAVQTLSIPKRPLELDKHSGNRCSMANENSYDLFDTTLALPPKSAAETLPLSGNDVDSLSGNSDSSATSIPGMPCLIPGRRLWASKSGHHILGLIEDYHALRKQIVKGQRLLDEMDVQIQEVPDRTVWEQETEGLQSAPLSRFVTTMSAAKLILKEASRLLKLFWRASLPTNGQCTHHCEQVGDLKTEISKLQKKLFEQDKKLQNTVKLLQLSKHQEKVIFDQLVVTHKILRKARGNLELRPGGAHPGTSSPSRPGS